MDNPSIVFLPALVVWIGRVLVKFVRRKATFLTDMSVTISSEHLMQNQLLSKFTEYAYTIATVGSLCSYSQFIDTLTQICVIYGGSHKPTWLMLAIKAHMYFATAFSDQSWISWLGLMTRSDKDFWLSTTIWKKNCHCAGFSVSSVENQEQVS